MTTKFFPTVMLLLSVSSAIPYFAEGDFRRGIYWLAAAAITACVTY